MGWLSRVSTLGWVGICVGIALLIVLIAAATGGLKPHGQLPQSCYDAQNADSLANDTSLSEHDRAIASYEYVSKKQECEADGGDVP